MRQIQPGLILALLISSCLKAVLPYITIFFSARIITALERNCEGKTLLQLVILTLASVATFTTVLRVFERRKDALNSISWNAWSKLLSDKLLQLDYQDLDDAEIIDKLSQIRQINMYNGGGYFRVVWSMEGLLQAGIGILTAVSLTIMLFTKKVPPGSSYAFLNTPLFLLLIIVLLIVIVLVSPMLHTKSNDLMYGNIELAKFSNRMLRHFQTYSMNHSECGMDIRIYGHQKIGKYYVSQDQTWLPGGPMAKLTWGKAGFLDILAEAVSVFSIIVVYTFVCLKALGGAFGIGEVTQYVGAFTALTGSLSGLFNEIGRLHNNTKYLDQLYEFLDLPNRMYQGTLSTEKRSDRQYEVEFRDVSFRYPGTDFWALRHVSMKFNVGEHLAIVGENGSGKTTFIKLLCRLYDPTEGQILLNGIDIRKYNYRDYMEVFSVVFQDYKLLSFPLGQNVAAAAEYDETRATQALTDAGFEEKLSELPQSLSTCLGHDFEEDGIELSGGEAQKVAIARALYKNGAFIILDEPTASLDPIAEAEIYEKFDEISGDRTAIYISHRLSSCKFCDEIAVFDEGHIVQQGSHEELLKDESGKYFELWTSQAKYYQ